jgi:alanine racemase
MGKYTLQEMAAAMGGKMTGRSQSRHLSIICTDTRKIIQPGISVFIALSGPRNDGHTYIAKAYERGIRSFVVHHVDAALFPEAGFVVVEDTLAALQALAAWHRQHFKIPVIGVTGSNGKTVVKEWLFQLLREDMEICRSPKSYNSQVGVPLSVWNMSANDKLAIFEAGVSSAGDMSALETIIQPEIGIITNLGPAHDAGFASREQKLKEKLLLFRGCSTIIYCKDHEIIDLALKGRSGTISWGFHSEADYVLKSMHQVLQKTEVEIESKNGRLLVEIPFTDKAYIENCLQCIITMLLLGYSADVIRKRVLQLRILPMRLELKYGIRGCTLIDDSYSADLLSLEVALDFFRQQESRKKKTLIISAFEGSGVSDTHFVAQLIDIIREYKFEKVIGVGDLFIRFASRFLKLHIDFHTFHNTESLLGQLDGMNFDREIILIKGARNFHFERITFALQGQTHRTVLEIDLNAMTDNLNVYRSNLNPGVGIIPMVKAFSYGSGSTEIASLLEEQQVPYLAVAYVDEGVQLREGGTQTRIMVMNADVQDFPRMVEYRLEPEIYSRTMLQSLIHLLESSGYPRRLPVHIKLETGMNRLGFVEEELDDIIYMLMDQDVITVSTIFSHLAASDERSMDDYSLQQIETFDRMCFKITSTLSYPVKKHLLNSSGIVRFPQAQYNFVRLGIGLYGIDSSADIQAQLQPVGTLKTRISQLKKVAAGNTVGYSRKGKVETDKVIAVIAIGYADGFDRRYSNGVGEVFIRGKRAPIIGNVCMDMAMADVTHIPDAKEGDEVEIYGKNISIIERAKAIGTIPYELLTHISSRVKRVYFWS